MSDTRKYLSGHDKRKKRKRVEEFIESQRGAIDRFIVKESKNSSLEDLVNEEKQENNGNELHEGLAIENDIEGDVNEIEDNESGDDLDFKNNYSESDDDAINEVNEEPSSSIPLDIFDPKNWENLDPKWKDQLVEKGPIRDVLTGKGPKDRSNRRFSSDFYTRILPNGQKHHRDWLVYSQALDKAFCFCCKLFKRAPQPSQLANEGYCDWGHLSSRLKEHETSIEHINYYVSWSELRIRLMKGTTIDHAIQDQIKKAKEHWRKVLHRLISLVKFLAKQNIAFRGSNEKLYDDNNGNFMVVVEMIAEWDSVMREHIERNTHHHYLSHKIQNELICLLASQIKSSILEIIKKAKFFSVILDCTPDVSNQEQMTLVIRCVDVSTSPMKVEEYFLGFLKVDDTTGQGLFEELQNVLKSFDLDIDNVRGQGYDNGANMKGRHQGVQKKLLDINPRALYTPCGCHCLNLTLCDIANSCGKAKDFFGVVQRIYTIFSHSTKRWKILIDHVTVKGLTLKPLSITRWESRTESVKAVVLQAQQIREALLQVAEEKGTDSKIRSEAKSLATFELGNFEFLVGMIIWYEILGKVNIVSKSLQSENMLIDVAMTKIKGLIASFEEYRESGFGQAINTAKELASTMEIDPVFLEKRQIYRKRHFDEVTYESSKVPQESAEEAFRVHYFLFIVDQTIGSLKKRFEQYEEYEDLFGFLFTAEKLSSLIDEDLKARCKNLERKLQRKNGTRQDVSDLDGDDLYQELKIIQHILPKETKTASEILIFLQRMNCFPNSFIAYRILLTIPVTVASAERSFSKLKLLKSCLRSTMTQTRLNALAMISIESEFLEKLNYEKLIDDFANKTARRSVFHS
ncbi:zinc finger MYM-type protein 1-like [Zingiber officinale]|uniref:zinc finger MYM-type protein 1-like n=1 Tax=Zingiber officinale TaxID=94328 RepID=UPI001C4BDEDC|nr:zinc finger MYM-type protein 1-like [Zingiber officinale]